METYKCKKCGAEFPKPEGIAEYRAHCLKCKSEDPKEEIKEEKDEIPKKKTKADNAAIEKAKAINACRGYYENNKTEICLKYMSCADCWADYTEK